MPKKYHIPVKNTNPRFHPVGKYTTVEFRENCAGSCKLCVKKNCVYEIFKDNYQHISSMDEPEYLYNCQSCFRCVQECTMGIFSRVINPEYRTLGDHYWRPDIIQRAWYQAQTGKVPVSGAGYRGPFVGHGFDSMWTDMSEIVRPTRDGIHGREYINTSIELSRRVTPLAFNPDMSIASDLPPLVEIPLPLLLQAPDDLVKTETVLLAMGKAAAVLGTLMLIQPEDYTASLDPVAANLIPCITLDNWEAHADRIKPSRAVEIAYCDGVETCFDALRALNPDIAILVGAPLDDRAASRALTLTQANVDSIHFYADRHGNERNTPKPRFVKDMIRDIHLNLVDHSCRQQVNLIFSGGMAMAEHMAKAIICGADGVCADLILMVALECRLCGLCQQGAPCPVSLDQPFNDNWASQRIVNLVGSWHSQLIEVMGAMGIREARRLRGEVGRSMWFEDLEKENFGPIFGERKVAGLG